MPLSEDEQRILRQIEEQLQRDPSFGREGRQRTGGSRRGWIVSVGLTVVLLAVAVALLAVSPYLSFVAFIGAVAAGVVAGSRLRAVGEQSLNNLGETMRSRMSGPEPRRQD
jgi:hypothetical protein